MKKIILFSVVMLAAGCSGEDRQAQYQSGWSQARADGCQCDPFLSAPHVEEQALQSAPWANGYTQGCVSARKDPTCRTEKPRLDDVQDLQRPAPKG